MGKTCDIETSADGKPAMKRNDAILRQHRHKGHSAGVQEVHMICSVEHLMSAGLGQSRQGSSSVQYSSHPLLLLPCSSKWLSSHKISSPHTSTSPLTRPNLRLASGIWGAGEMQMAAETGRRRGTIALAFGVIVVHHRAISKIMTLERSSTNSAELVTK